MKFVVVRLAGRGLPGLDVIISEGGVSVASRGWDYTCRVQPPSDISTLTQKQKGAIVKAALLDAHAIVWRFTPGTRS